MPLPSACSNCLTLPSPELVTGALSPSHSSTFALIRHALIARIPGQGIDAATPLAPWASHTAAGSALFEFWAYVGDIIAVYNRAIAIKARILTAQDRRSLRQLAELLGYQPRPAVGTNDEIAALVSSSASFRLPATAYRATPTNSSLAQVFEATGDPKVGFTDNEFTLQPIRNQSVGDLESDGLLLNLSTAAAVRGRPILFSWLDKIIRHHAAEIVDVSPERAGDGQSYVRLRVTDSPPIASFVEFGDVAAVSPSQKAYARTALLSDEAGSPIREADDVTNFIINDPKGPFARTSGGHSGNKKHSISAADFTSNEKTQSTIDLDSVYRSILAGDHVIIQYNAYFSSHLVTLTEEATIAIQLANKVVGPEIPITRISVNPAIDPKKIDFPVSGPLIVHYNMHDIGRLMRVAHTELTPVLVLDETLALEGVHSPIPNPPTEFILEDANGRGVLVEGQLAVGPSGAATLKVTKGDWTGGLRVPVKAYGNVIKISRGETIQNEVLGDGDQSQPYQTFQLARSPLTYLQSDTPRGITSTLEVRVDGVLWHERPSFYGARPNDPVYIVRHDDEQNTAITFGDGVRGLRLPTGSRNVRATYRHGAGADAPAPGAINQIVKGAPGLMYVRSPIQARGGADAESIRDIRRNAPASALVLGRCVSLADYSARVAGIPGILNSKVEYAWDEASLTAGVKVWYVPNVPGTDMSKDIVANLRAMSEPGLVIRAAAATPVESALFINLEIDPGYLPADIESAVQAALLDPEKGLLAPENTPIGGPLSRSAFVAVARAIPGVLDVTSVQFGLEIGPDTFPAPGLRLPAGHYFNFGGEHAGNVVVGAVRAESRGCRDLVS
jgi:hypothetical protein